MEDRRTSKVVSASEAKAVLIQKTGSTLASPCSQLPWRKNSENVSIPDYRYWF